MRNQTCNSSRSTKKWTSLPLILVLAVLTLPFCKKDNADDTVPPATDNPKFTIAQTMSDEAQRNTIAFGALGFMVGNLGSQTFLPPGKVADYSGFQYLRDNDPTNMGHNTSFVTIIAYNVLNILTPEQIQLFVTAAKDQVALINEYAYKRYPLCMAFRRLMDGDLPQGKTQLDIEAVKAYSAGLYKIDGAISYNRAQLFGKIINAMSTQQIAKLKALAALKGIGNWNSTLADPLRDLRLDRDVSVGVMTYASEIYAWYAGSVDADVYFCPERQGTYFGSFYLKDWPAMGNPNFTINEQLTASAGQNFLKTLTPTQYSLIASLVDLQKPALQSIVNVRRLVSIELRKFLVNSTPAEATVLSLSEDYGRYDGEIVYNYASRFAQVYQSLSTDQKAQLKSMSDALGYLPPSGGFLYSGPIPMPAIENTDYFFK